MRAQVFGLRNRLKYCSPFGPVLHDLRQATRGTKSVCVGIGTRRRLEEAGIGSVEALAQLGEDDLVRVGVRRDFARLIRTYIICCSQQPCKECSLLPQTGRSGRSSSNKG
jgi:helicase